MYIYDQNYTGDRLNFGVAVERAKQEGIKAKMIIVDDDAALPITKGITGGRGLAGTIFVHKVAGALSTASPGFDLDYTHTYLSDNIVPYIRTLGFALTTCTVPGTPASDRLAAPDSYEVGLGIHGEPGREKCILPQKDIAKSIASTLVDGILDISEPPVPEPEPEPEPEAEAEAEAEVEKEGGLEPVPEGDVLKPLDVEVNAGEKVLPLSEPIAESNAAPSTTTPVEAPQDEASGVDEPAPVESKGVDAADSGDSQATPRQEPIADLPPVMVPTVSQTANPPFATPMKGTPTLPRTAVKTPSSALFTPSKGSFRFNFEEPAIERRPQRLPVTAGAGDELVLIVNNLGSLPIIEMYVLVKEVLLEMRRRRLNPVRVYVGHFMTSLDMSGCSLSVLKTDSFIPDTYDETPSVLSLLDAITDAPAWVKSQAIDLLSGDAPCAPLPYNEADYRHATSEAIIAQSKVDSSCAVALVLAKQVCLKLIEIEPTLTKYDQICGDGDCGLVMKAGASKILADIYSIDVNDQEFNLMAALKTISSALLPDDSVPVTPSSKVYKACGHNPALLCDRIATSISESMGGTSGILLEICFRTMSTYILDLDPASVDDKLWINALDRGVTAIQNYGGNLIPFFLYFVIIHYFADILSIRRHGWYAHYVGCVCACHRRAASRAFCEGGGAASGGGCGSYQGHEQPGGTFQLHKPRTSAWDAGSGRCRCRVRLCCGSRSDCLPEGRMCCVLAVSILNVCIFV